MRPKRTLSTGALGVRARFRTAHEVAFTCWPRTPCGRTFLTLLRHVVLRSLNTLRQRRRVLVASAPRWPPSRRGSLLVAGGPSPRVAPDALGAGHSERLDCTADDSAVARVCLGKRRSREQDVDVARPSAMRGELTARLTNGGFHLRSRGRRIFGRMFRSSQTTRASTRRLRPPVGHSSESGRTEAARPWRCRSEGL